MTKWRTLLLEDHYGSYGFFNFVPAHHIDFDELQDLFTANFETRGETLQINKFDDMNFARAKLLIYLEDQGWEPTGFSKEGTERAFLFKRPIED